jgi:Protein of unknown function (DUF1559)
MITMYRYKRPGYASVDLLIAVFVLGTFLGIALPGCQQRVDEVGPRWVTMTNLGQCAKAVHTCHDQFKKFPPHYGPFGAKATPMSFHAHLLPFVEQGAMYENPQPAMIVPAFLTSMDHTQTVNGANACNFPVNLRLFYTQGGLGTLSGASALIYPKMPDSFPDGVGNTLLFATKYMHCGSGGSFWWDPAASGYQPQLAATFGPSMGLWQAAPSQESCDPTSGTAVSFLKRTIQIAMCDASVRTVAVGISQSTWQAIHTPGGNDAPGPDWVE